MVKLIGLALVAAATAAPIVATILLIATTGADNLSNDYIAYVGLVDRILAGTYDWRRYFLDTFLGGSHSMALPVLVRLGVVALADWSVFVELWVVIALSCARLVLLRAALTGGTRGAWVLWPVLAALVFSPSQVNMFTYGDAGLQIALNQCAFTLGVWGLARFPGHWLGVWIMGLSGIAAALSGGAGLLAFPVFLLGMALLGFRRPAHYAAWLAAAVVASMPYLVYGWLEPTPTVNTLGSPFRFRFMVQALGWPFANGINADFTRNAMAFRHGLVGVALGVAGGIVLLSWIRRRSPAWREAAPALMLMAHGLLCVWQLSALRAFISPWHTPWFMTWWVGLAGLAWVAWAHRADTARPTPWALAGPRAAAVWGIVVLVALTALYAVSNRSYEDKALYLFSRSPASAACLRHYREAPSYCEERLFQWGVGNPELIAALARPLERHRLNVFSPQQRWTLQGDFGLPRVGVENTPGVPDVAWWADPAGRRLPWWHYRHLDLFVHAPNAVTWAVSLPASTTRAALHSAVALGPVDDAAADGVTFEVSVERPPQPPRVAFRRRMGPRERRWEPFTVDLGGYAGQSITLRFTSAPGRTLNADWALYRHPYIDLTLDPARPAVDPPAPRDSPGASTADLVLAPADAGAWRATAMQPLSVEPGAPPAWQVEGRPRLDFLKPLHACLADYTYLLVRVGASADIRPRAMRVSYRVEGASPAAGSFAIPLEAAAGLREYTYDLKLLELDQKARLTGLSLAPVETTPATGERRVEIAEIRLIRDERRAFCKGGG